MFSCKYCKVVKNSFFLYLLATASVAHEFRELETNNSPNN